MPRVSVIIPTHNRAGMLQEAIRSVLGQTYRDFDLWVVDDGSTDETPRVVENFTEGIHYIRQPHRGVSSARNLGAGLSRGEWIAFLDSDDLWLPRKLERQLEELDRNRGYRLCHTDEIWVRDGRRVNPGLRHRKYGGWIFRRCLPLCIISPSSVLIHRGLFEETGGFDERLPACEDYDLWLRIAAREPVLFLEEKLIVKRGGHQDQLSRSTWGLDRFRVLAIRKVLRDPNIPADLKDDARRELRRKCGILVEGARKRGRSEAARLYLLLSTWPYDDEGMERRVLEEDLVAGD